ncbi:hypothetical protein [Burkholderia thailandensis]|uniref:hypothetical protein n=1 Tax=Burkholderia thailandensis TaxID=57975 RepID=UPI0003EC7860|nr:hypothetical protein [Burkholderia thailandensis]AHI68480.1 hypothetical protein BTL_3441 [Burkholderia thailandensis H0587]AOJ53293.1 hypothetical protein AQ475_20655 [Burkholderia thailandensis]AVR28585.1 hypothetical protein A8H32_27430 [Burkholderia thailandensis]MCZ2895024.1 hypothetical protein [Burkholderia thailandensis]MCZ2899187.1 hypothetical protein [Burkholderia thailandensis]
MRSTDAEWAGIAVRDGADLPGSLAREARLDIQYNPSSPFIDGDPSVARLPALAPGGGSAGASPGMAKTIARVLASRRSHR